MKKLIALASIAVAATGLVTIFAADPTPSTSAPGASPNDSEMMKQMMEMAKPGDNQKVLGQLAGTWSYRVKFWMSPGMPPSESSGNAVCTMSLGGRYLIEKVSGKMEMPDATGKMKDMQFRGMGIDGYDNAKQKFVSSWIDNMGTGILLSEGSYDPASKTFTYNADEEMTPGTVTKVRELLKLTDKDHHTFEWYETRTGGQEIKTMEITYTRAK